MNRAEVDALLADRMLSYADLRGVAVSECGEQLVSLEGEGIRVRQIDPDMLAITGAAIYVRERVAVALRAAAVELRRGTPELELEVVYGYRSLAIQTALFNAQRQRLSASVPANQLIEATHRLIAVPEVAGHPTGGAVDLQVLERGAPWDMGSPIWGFVADAAVFSPFVSQPAWTRRQRLRRVMMSSGFAPFDGEWWHFSLGDREWARFYERPAAEYAQLEFTGDAGP